MVFGGIFGPEAPCGRRAVRGKSLAARVYWALPGPTPKNAIPPLRGMTAAKVAVAWPPYLHQKEVMTILTDVRLASNAL